MNATLKCIIFMGCTICLLSIKCFAPKINDYGLYFGSQEHFIGYIDYNFFRNLSTCTPYTTPIVINAPLIVPNGYYKSQIIGLQENKCIVKNFSKNSSWELISEYQIPMTYAKDLSTILMREIKNPDLRLKHLKEYCTSERNKQTTQACNYLQTGIDKDDFFLHINLGLTKYKTYPNWRNQIPTSGRTMYSY